MFPYYNTTSIYQSIENKLKISVICKFSSENQWI